MIYFDNGATGGFKPRAVTDSVENVVRYLSANPGRSGHRLSVTGANVVYDCRYLASQVFGASPERVIFTKNCTEALNLAIFGTLKKGGHVVTTVFEHNSVLRPLSYLKKLNLISLDIVSPSEGQSITEAIENAVNDDTYLIVMNGASNVTGEVFPVKEVGKTAEKHGLLFLCDGAQLCGHSDVNLSRDGISMLACAGHKGLYGIMGSGMLIIRDGVEVSPLTFGGTGTESLSLDQPTAYPERLESGTLNLPAISALKEGLSYVSENLSAFSSTLLKYTSALIGGLSETENVTVYSSPNPTGIVSFSVKDVPSPEVSDVLDKYFDVATRAGLHCSPLCHKYLGTDKDGLVRASLSVQNSTREINYFLRAVKKIAEGGNDFLL